MKLQITSENGQDLLDVKPTSQDRLENVVFGLVATYSNSSTSIEDHQRTLFLSCHLFVSIRT